MKKKPRYYDVTLHLCDRPVGDEKYLTHKDIRDLIDRDLEAGVKVTQIRIKETTKR